MMDSHKGFNQQIYGARMDCIKYQQQRKNTSKPWLSYLKPVPKFLLNGHVLFIFVLFQAKILQEKLQASAGFELGSSDLKASKLTT